MDHTRKRYYYKKKNKQRLRDPNQNLPAVKSQNTSEDTKISAPPPIVRSNQMISVVIPLFNEEESLIELSSSLENELAQLRCNYEVIFVDDGSTDRSFLRISEIH